MHERSYSVVRQGRKVKDTEGGGGEERKVEVTVLFTEKNQWWLERKLVVWGNGLS